jgi:hypothetical protein
MTTVAIDYAEELGFLILISVCRHFPEISAHLGSIPLVILSGALSLLPHLI